MYYNLPIPSIPKNNSFHLIRLVCCLFVIYEHSVLLSQVDYISMGFSGLAVKVFFILSGFWVTISLLRVNTIKDYVLKRCKKIIPPYFTVVILSVIILSFFSSLSKKEYFSSIEVWQYLLANLSALNFLHPNLPGVFENLPDNGVVNGALWTIKIEIAFYICLPFFLHIMDKCKNKQAFVLLIFYIISVLYSIAIYFITPMKGSFAKLEHQFPAFITYFICGMVFVFYYDKLQTYLKYLLLPSIVVLILKFYTENWFLNIVILPVGLSIVVFWIAIKLTFLGNVVSNDFSFGMYLVHCPLIMLFVQNNFFSSCWFLAFIGIISLSFFCSYFLTKSTK